jgi:Icc-related predicted phosphoesterase
MRVAALYDVHGNLPALEAVLDEIARADVDAIVVGGDVVAGPCASSKKLKQQGSSSGIMALPAS